MSITFFAQGTPKPQPRPRAFARNLGGGKFAARVYDGGTAEGWKAAVALAAKPFLPVVPMAEPLRVGIMFMLERPQSHRSAKGGIKASAPSHPVNKMDCDNLAKAVLDCLTQIGLWRDDGQIVSLTIEKSYTLQRPGAWVRISKIEPL